MRIKIFWVGKTKNPAIRALAMDYLERTRHMTPCEIVEVRDPAKARDLRGSDLVSAEGALLSRLLAESAKIVVLDERGREFTSSGLARWVDDEQNRGTKEIDFVIGGPDGLCSEILRKAHLNLSLGRMTWTHEMCRALLLEQIYRSFSILRNMPYHK